MGGGHRCRGDPASIASPSTPEVAETRESMPHNASKPNEFGRGRQAAPCFPRPGTPTSRQRPGPGSNAGVRHAPLERRHRAAAGIQSGMPPGALRAVTFTIVVPQRRQRSLDAEGCRAALRRLARRRRSEGCARAEACARRDAISELQSQLVGTRLALRPSAVGPGRRWPAPATSMPSAY